MATVVEFAMRLDGVDQVVRGFGRAEQAGAAMARGVSGTRRGLDDSRRGLDNLGQGLDLASRKAENFAGAALEGIIPVSGRVSDALFDIVGASSRGASALQLFAKASLIVGGALAVAKVVEAAEHYVKFGETVEGLTDRLKKAAEEQEKFLDNLKKTGDLRRSLARQLVESRSSTEAAIDRGAGNELAAARHELEGRLELIEFEADARRRTIAETTKDELARNEFLKTSEAITLLERRKAHEAWGQALLKNIQDERAARVQAWKDETTAFIEQLRARLTARQQFEQQLGQGAEGLGVTDSATTGLRQLATARENFRKAMRDVAFFEREGVLRPDDARTEREKLVAGFTKTAEGIKAAFGGVPAVVDAVNASILKISIAPFSTAMEQARDWVNANIATVEELDTRYQQLSEQLTAKLPAAVAVAEPAIKKLTQDVNDLATALFKATEEARAFDAAVTSRSTTPGAGGRRNTGIQVVE